MLGRRLIYSATRAHRWQGRDEEKEKDGDWLGDKKAMEKARGVQLLLETLPLKLVRVRARESGKARAVASAVSTCMAAAPVLLFTTETLLFLISQALDSKTKHDVML